MAKEKVTSRVSTLGSWYNVPSGNPFSNHRNLVLGGSSCCSPLFVILYMLINKGSWLDYFPVSTGLHKVASWPLSYLQFNQKSFGIVNAKVLHLLLLFSNWKYEGLQSCMLVYQSGLGLVLYWCTMLHFRKSWKRILKRELPGISPDLSWSTYR